MNLVPITGEKRGVLTAVLLAILLSLLFVALPVQLSAADEAVWDWFDKCSNAKKLTVQVILNHKNLYKASVPICRQRRRDIPVTKEQKRLTFSLEKKVKHSFFGEPKDQGLEATIWRVEGDQNYLTLGISFAAKKRIWLNTLHFAYPDNESKSRLAPGLLIKTFPGKSRSQRK